MSRQLELFNEAKQKWINSTKESAKRDYNFDTLSGESLDKYCRVSYYIYMHISIY